jgi:hypothetical protein
MATKKHNMVIAQGDVLIRKISALPKDVKQVSPDAGRTVLAYGEVTGHAHACNSTEARLFQNETQTFLVVDKESAVLAHNEHSNIPFAPKAFAEAFGRELTKDEQNSLGTGVFEVRRQIEYVAGELRTVAD